MAMFLFLVSYFLFLVCSFACGQISTWAVCGDREQPVQKQAGDTAEDDGQEHEGPSAEAQEELLTTVARCGFNSDQKKLFGFMAKRLFDLGRIQFLQGLPGCVSTSYKVAAVAQAGKCAESSPVSPFGSQAYVPSDVTPENMALIATW